MTSIPVYLNNRNRLASLRGMVERLSVIPGAVPIVVDNDSSYPPLLDWYEHAPCEVIRTGRNGGPQAVYGVLPSLGGFKKRWGHLLLAMSDSDLDISGVPGDFLEVLAEGTQRFDGIDRCGLSLEINDVPKHYPFRDQVLSLESRYWDRPLDDLYFDADVATTFVMVRRDRPFVYRACRTNRPYTARHLPWYVDPDCLDNEEAFFLAHATAHGPCWTAKMRGVIAEGVE